jgi:hypothetical protein
MLHITVPNMPETLSYSVLASLGVELVIAILLAVRGDWLGMLLVLVIAGIVYWFVCRQLVAVVGARFAAAAGALILLLCALLDIAFGHPYYGLLFLLGAAVLGFVSVLLQQGGVPAELQIGGIAAIRARDRRPHLRMLEELRDAGLLTADEFAAKSAMLGL